jgi:hypothetical protein
MRFANTCFRRLAAGFGLLALMLALDVGCARAERVSNAQIIRDFNIIAFGNEYTGRRYRHVRKWAKPIRVGILGKHPPYFEAFIKQHVRDMWEITGFPIELRYSERLAENGRLAKDFERNEVNFVLFYFPAAKLPSIIKKLFKDKVDEAEIAKMIRISTCHARFFTKDNEITIAYAAFPAEHPKDYMRACVVEELTQVMGLPNDSPDIGPSIFTDRGKYNELTEHDRWMLKMLYDPRITVGMPRENALVTGKRILDELRPGF